MYIGIIGAMEEEIQELKEEMTEVKKKAISAFTFYLGKIKGKDVVLAQCQEGKVNAAICTQTMILNFDLSAIINVGVAGAVSKKLEIGGIAISRNTVEFDMDVSALQYELGYIFGLDRVFMECDSKLYYALGEIASKNNNVQLGTIASSDRFVTDEETKVMLEYEFNTVAVDMESASICHTCLLNKIPFVALRAISDSGNSMEYKEFVSLAVTKLHDIICEYLEVYV